MKNLRSFRINLVMEDKMADFQPVLLTESGDFVGTISLDTAYDINEV